MATRKPVALNGADAVNELTKRLFGALNPAAVRITEGEGLEYHESPKILVPDGMSYDDIRAAVNRAEREAETHTRWTRKFNYRFNDGAYALLRVLKKRFGGAVGESTMTFFGPEPPELVTIDIAYGETAQVPEGKLSLPALPGLTLASIDTGDREYGRVYMIVAEGPRKHADVVKSIFEDVEHLLTTESIYRGQALVGADQLAFVDLSKFRADEIVFSEKASRLLHTAILGPLAAWRDLEAEGVPLKRAALLYGPYGTGKTSAGLIAAQAAVRAGWTALTARAGRDSVETVLRTARLYQPAVVFVEDIDNEAANSDNPQSVSRLLETFDGATSKGAKIMVVVTTNHLDRVHKGLLRPGRFDAVIEIGSLDATGIEGLVKAVVPAGKLATDVDWKTVTDKMVGFYPAFVREAVDRARIVAVTAQGRNYLLDTEALVRAAESVVEQLRVLESASEGEPTPGLDAAFTNAVRAATTGLKVQGSAGDNYVVQVGSNLDDDSEHFDHRAYAEMRGRN